MIQHLYNTLDQYLKDRFEKKVFKVSLNGGFTCPNRDGTISNGGCIFCSSKGSGDFAGDPKDNLKTQFNVVKNTLLNKWPDAYYIAYFQANTNTYAPLSRLKELYEEAITLDKDIKILSIATRPDCISDEILDYLNELNKRIEVWSELGLQTVNDETAKIINRGYPLSVFDDTVKRLRSKNISVIVHVINGLPNDSELDNYNTVKHLNTLDIQGIKFHCLCILKQTKLELMYKEGKYAPISLEDYTRITANQIALLDEKVVVHRIGADAPIDLLVQPIWTRKKFVVMNEIDKYMRENNLYQGKNKSLS